MALGEFARTVGGSKGELEAIWNAVKAVVNGNASHGDPER
jgi:hypothetical protein